MRAAELKGKKVVIWGAGKEGRGVAEFIRRFVPEITFTYVQDTQGLSDVDPRDRMVQGKEAIAPVLAGADIIIKSPGVSLYHPLLKGVKAPVTSLLNLWFAEKGGLKTIMVTGTKGKSTTSSLIAHILNRQGVKTCLAGNIGTPVSEMNPRDFEMAVIETSSYQAANFEGAGDIGVLVSLYPEHLDWHGSEAAYYRDKLRLIETAQKRILSAQTVGALKQHGFAITGVIAGGAGPQGFHVRDGAIWEGAERLGAPPNDYLSRPHNMNNVCLALAVAKELGLDARRALADTKDFRPLPHRQNELGEKDGLIFVDDSISTMPQAAIAALEVYKDKPVTLLAGGFDRGLDYAVLADAIVARHLENVICLGPSGARIAQLLKDRGYAKVFSANDMKQALDTARKNTPKGGVVLLSPGAPSYGLFKDFTERGRVFAKEAGFEI